MNRLFLFFLSALFILSMSLTPSSPKYSEYKPGTLLVSIDNGQNWQNISANLPDDIKVSSICPFNSAFYLGTNKGLFKSNYIFPKAHWYDEKGFDKEILKLYPHENKLLFTTLWYGLNEFAPNISNFSKISSDSHIGIVNSVIKVTESLLYFCSEYGLYKSTDSGNHWTKVYNKGIIRDMIKIENKIIIGGKFGIMSSDLSANQWEQSLIPDCIITKLIQTQNELYAIGVYENQFMHIPNSVYQSLDHGKSWKKLDLPSKVPSIHQIIKSKDYYFISCDEGVFRSKTLNGEWIQVQAKPVSNYGFHKLYYHENYLFCIYSEPNC
ncbi:MAG: hypothetical protein HOP11_07085 [Saprospiraceae bacterium]|nr:hypothetical protein [Saprospiraceae bacterium]